MAIAHATPANGLRVVLFIVLMGPPIGSLRMRPLAGLINGFGFCEAEGYSIVTQFFGTMLMFRVFGYIFGGLPALISAVWLGQRRLMSGGFGWREAMLSEMSAPVECLHNLGNI